MTETEMQAKSHAAAIVASRHVHDLGMQQSPQYVWSFEQIRDWYLTSARGLANQTGANAEVYPFGIRRNPAGTIDFYILV